MNMIKAAASMLFPLISFPYTSRVLGPDGTGKLNFATSFVAYFILLASIGIPLYGIREVAKVRDDPSSLSALVQELLVMHGGASVLSFLAFLGMILLNNKIHAEILLFLIVSASIPLSMLTMDWFYQGIEEYAYITVRSISFSALSLVALFLFVHHEGDYWLNAFITIVASLGSSVLNFWNARQVIFAPRRRPWDFRRHLKPLFTGYLLNFIISIYVNLDTVMLGFLTTARNVGYYASAMKLTKMLLAMVSSFSSVLLPRLSYYTSNGMYGEFNRILQKSLGIMCLLCAPVTMALILMSREIILVFAGPKYLPAVTCVAVTAPVIIAIGLNGIFGFQILYSKGKERMFIAAVLVGAVVNVVINLLLIPRMAHIGAAWGAAIAEIVILLVEIIMVRTFYQVHWPWLNMLKYFLATATMSGFLLLVRHQVPEARLWLRIILDVPLGAAIYFFLLFLMKEEFMGEVYAKLKGRLHA